MALGSMAETRADRHLFFRSGNQTKPRREKMKAYFYRALLKFMKLNQYRITKEDGSYTTVYTFGPMLDGETKAIRETIS
jgi:hypothetical protein